MATHNKGLDFQDRLKLFSLLYLPEREACKPEKQICMIKESLSILTKSGIWRNPIIQLDKYGYLFFNIISTYTHTQQK